MSDLELAPKIITAKAAAASKLPDIPSLKSSPHKDGDAFFVGTALYVYVSADSTAEDGLYSISPVNGNGRFRKVMPKLRLR